MKVNFGWGLVYTCFAIVALMNIALFFYLTQQDWSANIKVYSVIGSIPGLTITCILESFYQKYHKTRYLITLGGLMIMIVTIFTPESITTSLANLFLLFLVIFLISFFITLLKGSTGALRKNIWIFSLAFFAFSIGELLLNPRVIEEQLVAGQEIYLTGFIGRGLRICALFLMATVLFEQPLFYELNWKENLIQIIVIHKKNGIAISHRKFQEFKERNDDKRELSETFIAGGITGISALLKEISQSSEELKILDHGDQKILLEHGESISIALNVLDELNIYWDKLRKIRIIIENIYGALLKNFDGELQVYKPIEGIIDNEFM